MKEVLKDVQSFEHATVKEESTALCREGFEDSLGRFFFAKTSAADLKEVASEAG